MQRLQIFQSLWAMERRQTDGIERSVEDNVAMIADAGFEGLSAQYTDRETVRRIAGLCRARGLGIEGICFPKTVDELKPALDLAHEFDAAHLTVQPNVRPRRLQEAIAILEGWQRLAEQSIVPVYIETHRGRMTNDLLFTLDLIDSLPDLRLLGDLSHFVVAREFAWPVEAEHHRLIERVLDHCWAFHGRVASCEQVQVEISFPHHRIWVDLFLRWWDYGFRSWRRRAGPDATLTFTCELGPKPYAITGRDGNDTTDRFAEALALRDMIRDLWASTDSPPSQGGTVPG